LILIAHRGLLSGPNEIEENKIKSIENCLDEGYNVEVDVMLIGDELFLGHDEPQEKCPWWILESKKTWIHAKTVKTFHYLTKNKIPNLFYHTDEDVVLTTSMFLWTNLNKELTEISICVLPEQTNQSIKDIRNCYGICTDYPIRYEKELK